ncbi:MAG: GatB/YqeY domain-containing protein [Thermoleophilia bacterium]
MSITTDVQRDMVAAMKSGDKPRLAALRMILSQLQMGLKNAPDTFGEADEIAVLMTEKKKRLQSAQAFRDGDRVQRAEGEEYEATLIDTYLPRALSEAELGSIVDEAIAAVGATGPRDMGKVMSRVMPRVAGRADGKAVSALVQSRLAG